MAKEGNHIGPLRWVAIIFAMAVLITCYFLVHYEDYVINKEGFTEEPGHIDITELATKLLMSSENDTVTKPTFDFDGPCDVKNFSKILHDKLTPLTTEALRTLRGCLVLTYLRTPRTGSSMTRNIIIQLGELHNFTFNPHRVKSTSNISYWAYAINKAVKERSPWAMTPHMTAREFASSPEIIRPPVIIQMCRHPITHAMSIYNMVRQGSHGACNVSFSEHVLKRGLQKPCIKQEYMDFHFLSGNCRKCKTPANRLAHAKQNLEDLYMIVGVSENLPAFLFVLETILPNFFYGAMKVYIREPGLYVMALDDSTRIKDMNATTREHLNKILWADLDLYYFARSRFYNVLRKVIEVRANGNMNDFAYLTGQGGNTKQRKRQDEVHQES